MKTGLVLEGGGLRGIYTAGVLDTMLELGIQFEYVVGVSAGACNATSYISKQAGRAGRVILQNFMNPRYLGYRNLLLHGSIFGMDFVFNQIPNKFDPFDFDAFESSTVDFEVGATNIETGKTEYFSKEVVSREHFAVVRASSSIPLVAKIVTINGKKYLDGAIGDSIPIKHAMEKGYEKNVIILTQPRGFIKKPAGYTGLRKLYYRRYPKFIEAMENRHKLYNGTLRFIEQLEKEERVLVLAPQKPIPFASFEKNVQGMQKLYQNGIQDAHDNADKIRNFMGVPCAEHKKQPSSDCLKG